MSSARKDQIVRLFRAAATSVPEQSIRELRGEGKRVIGYLCSYVPQEILGVRGLVPYRMRAAGCGGTDVADTYMGRVTCSYTRCVLETVCSGGYDLLDGYVLTTGCDHMRRLHDNLVYLHSPHFVSILDIPHKTGPEAAAWYSKELERLVAELERMFGFSITEADLSAAIRVRNRTRKLLRALDLMREWDEPPLRGSEMLALASGSGALPAGSANPLLEELAQMVPGLPGAGGGRARARVILVSSQLDNPGYVEVLESMGAFPVAEVACTGATGYTDPVDDDTPPLEALATRYLEHVPCPRMMEAFEERFRTVLSLVRSRKAHGVVLACMKFCDVWGIETTLLTRALREAGVPVLRLEREYLLSGEGQVATRVQAFLESMGK